MEALQAEIARKRKLQDAAGGGQKRRWVRTGDLQRERQKEVEEKGKRDRPDAKPAAAEEAVAVPEADSKAVDERLQALKSYELADIFKRLRSRGEPVTLFAEATEERLRRLAALEVAKPVRDDGLRLAAGYEVGLKSAAPEEEEEEEEEEGSDGETGDHQDEKRIRRWIKRHLKAWEKELEARPDRQKRTPQGRVATRTYKQTKEYIRPLVRLCRQRALQPSMKGSLVEMVEFCEAGEFVKANDAYIQIAIGNAAWPIGVTSVGIHERCAREQVEQKNVAHVMNDEMARKYLTSFKRLMKVAQDARPDVAPSKKVM